MWSPLVRKVALFLNVARLLDLTVTMPAGQKYTFEIGTIN